MSKQEFAARLAERDDEITKLISELEEVKARKAEWLTAAKPAKDMEPLNEQLRIGQERLEDLAVTKAALEAKLRIYAQNEPEAAEIRKQIVDEVWPQVPKVLSKMQQALSGVSSAISELDSLNGSTRKLLPEYERLTGESLVGVPIISNLIPLELRHVAATQLPKLPETLELRFESEEIKKAQEKMDAAFNAKMAKQKALILPYLQAQNMQWPVCKRDGCGKELVLLAASVWDGSSEENPMEGPEVREKAFRLQFRCEGNGSHNGAQGFIRIEAGAYHLVPLHDLEVPR
jgi:hypothetical protein